jgi:hypothetical protein
MTTPERKRLTVNILPEPAVVYEVLTQSPDTSTTEDLDEEEEKKEEVPRQWHGFGHICAGCREPFNCPGDINGNAGDICRCVQEIAAYPEPHLIFYCSEECEEDDHEPSV